MRFCTFEVIGHTLVGVLDPASKDIAVLDVPDMLSLIRRPDALPMAAAALQGPGPRYALADVRLLAPVPRPDKNIFCVGLNYMSHNAEFTGGKAPPAHPVIFSKPPTTVIRGGTHRQPPQPHVRIGL